MKKEEIAYFKALLTEQLTELLGHADDTVSGMTTQKENYPDPTDRASLEADRNFLLRIRDRESKLIKKIKKTLERIEDGTFGICEGCGEEIGTERLKARPVTTQCIECKKKEGLWRNLLDCSPSRCIDLHVHSNASDGTFSPAELIQLARNSNLSALAITDHDTLDGSRKALEYPIPPTIQFLTGVELSASPPRSYTCSGSFHILGYNIQLDNLQLNETLNILQQARKNRNPQIIDRLNRLGIPISLEEITEIFGDVQIGRPHIAQVMLRKGLAGSVNEAFDNYLGKGKPAYVDKFRIGCDQAIELIRNAGGIPVLAHPSLLNLSSDKSLEDLIGIMKSTGLEGLEVYYPDHTPDQIAYYSDIARRNNLLMTGGTDFHGSAKPDISIGFGKGNFCVPFELYERLILRNRTDRFSDK